MAASFDAEDFSITAGGTSTDTALTLLKKHNSHVEIIGYRFNNVTDTSTKFKVTSADNEVLYLDASDADSKTLVRDIVPSLDDTSPGGVAALVDATGAAATIGTGTGLIAKCPLTITWLNAGTAGDVLTGRVFYSNAAAVTPFPQFTSGAATATTNLKSKYAQLLGFKAVTTSTDTATTLRLRDASGRFVYWDAADKDYTTAIRKQITYDGTITNLSVVHLDATGVAATATSSAPPPVVRSPITVDILNDANAAGTGTWDVSLFYRI